jgi:hypothetical protein
VRMRQVLAVLLVAVFTLGALNVSRADENSKLLKRVKKLTQRVVTLENSVSAVAGLSAQVGTFEGRLIDVELKTGWLDKQGVYRGFAEGFTHPVFSEAGTCESGDLAVWRPTPNSAAPSPFYITCEPPA